MVKINFDELKSKLNPRDQASFIGYSGGVWNFNCQGLDISFVCNDSISPKMYIQDILSRKDLEYIAIRKIGDKNFNYFWII